MISVCPCLRVSVLILSRALRLLRFVHRSPARPACNHDLDVAEHAAVQRPNVDTLANLISRQAVEEILCRLHRSAVEVEQQIADDDSRRIRWSAGSHADDQEPSLTIVRPLRSREVHGLNRDPHEPSRAACRQHLSGCRPCERSRDGDSKATNNRGGRDAGQLTGGIENPTPREPLVHRRGHADHTRDFPPSTCPVRATDDRDDSRAGGQRVTPRTSKRQHDLSDTRLGLSDGWRGNIQLGTRPKHSDAGGWVPSREIGIDHR
jgi:hypothetical protein